MLCLLTLKNLTRDQRITIRPKILSGPDAYYSTFNSLQKYFLRFYVFDKMKNRSGGSIFSNMSSKGDILMIIQWYTTNTGTILKVTPQKVNNMRKRHIAWYALCHILARQTWPEQRKVECQPIMPTKYISSKASDGQIKGHNGRKGNPTWKQVTWKHW